MQVFLSQHVEICAINCTYLDAIGKILSFFSQFFSYGLQRHMRGLSDLRIHKSTVGPYYIGIYTRLLSVFHLNPLARPQQSWMKKRIVVTRFLKSRSPGERLSSSSTRKWSFWFVLCVANSPFRWKWALFCILRRRTDVGGSAGGLVREQVEHGEEARSSGSGLTKEMIKERKDNYDR